MKNDIRFAIALLFTLLAKQQEPDSWQEMFLDFAASCWGAVAGVGWTWAALTGKEST